MNIKLRRGTREDAPACGVIDFEAFKSISSQHDFPWDFPSVEIATAVTTAMLSNPGFCRVTPGPATRHICNLQVSCETPAWHSVTV